jgi:plasmid maintenance system antidote protein VapI
MGLLLEIVVIWVWVKYFTEKSSPSTENQHSSAEYPNSVDVEPEVCQDTRQRLTVDSEMLTTTSIPDEQFQTEENGKLKRDNERLANQVIQLKLELSTLSSEHGEVRDELISTRCELYAKNRDITNFEKTISHLKNNPTALNVDDDFNPANTKSALAQNNVILFPEQEDKSTQTVDVQLPTTVVDNRIEELEDKYKKVCAHNTSMQRKMRGFHAARNILQSANEKLVLQLDSKAKELEEEKALSKKKIQELESDHQESFGKIRQYYQTLLNNRNCKNNELEETISELNSTIDECVENHRTEMEEMDTRYSKVIDEQNEHLMQLESRVAELTQKNCELNDTVDELELSSYALPDYYKILNVNRLDTDEKIMKSYREKILQAHPDKINQIQTDDVDKALMKANRLSQALNRAKDLLMNSRLRYQYDSWLDMTEIKKTEKKIWDYKAFEERKRYRN